MSKNIGARIAALHRRRERLQPRPLVKFVMIDETTPHDPNTPVFMLRLPQLASLRDQLQPPEPTRVNDNRT